MTWVAQVTTEKQREAFKKELAQAEDWLYEDGAAQSGPVFRYATFNSFVVTPVATSTPVDAEHEFIQICNILNS